MLVITAVDGSPVIRLENESATFRTGDGNRTLTADDSTGPVLVSQMAAPGGSMWLGAWRRVIQDRRTGITLHPPIIYSDRAVRQAAFSSSRLVARAHCFAGQVPALQGHEVLLVARSGDAFVVSDRWLRRRMPGWRRRASFPAKSIRNGNVSEAS